MRSILSFSCLVLFLFACGDNVDQQCPSAGGEMTRVPEGFCIDNHEVRRGDYFAWLESEPSFDERPEVCANNDDFLPVCFTTGAYGFDRFLENPVACADWCDAQAFCADAGKRLCGGRENVEHSVDDYADANKDEWFAACSSGGENLYPYGIDYEHNRCRESPDIGVVSWNSVAAGEYEQCQSSVAGYEGIFDMAGNLAEWQNACDDRGCRVRGGAYTHEANGLRCDAGESLRWPRLEAAADIGFRCCAD